MWEIGGAGALCALYFLAQDMFGAAGLVAVNLFGPLTLTLILLLGAWRQILCDHLAIWTALFAFRIATALYYGIGSLTPAFVNVVTWLSLQSVGYFDQHDMVKFNLVISLGVWCVLAVVWLVDVMLPYRPKSKWHNSRSRPELFVVALACYGIGALSKYGFVVPYAMGWQADVVPGVIVQLAALIYVGLFFLMLFALRFDRRWLAIAVPLVSAECLTGILMFNKTEVLLALIAPLLGVLTQRASFARLIAAGLTLLLVFAVLQPLVGYARLQFQDRFGATGALDLRARTEILIAYFTDPAGVPEADASVQSSWLRITYIAWGIRVVNLYDAAQPGGTLDNAALAFIPRWLWPDKPVMTDSATNLYTLATGQVGTSVSPGIFAEAYWNFGWWGLVVLIVPWAVVLATVSRFALDVVRSDAWLYMPAVFVAVRMGSRVDGLYVIDVIGPCLFMIAMIVVSSAISALFTTERPAPLHRQGHAAGRR